jgi:hypothetical protein
VDTVELPDGNAARMCLHFAERCDAHLDQGI